MKIINSFEEICLFFNNIVRENPSKPIIIWFGHEASQSNTLVDCFNKEFINQNVNILKENLGGVISSCSRSAIVFHRYLDQMEEAFLKDVVKTKQLSQKPVFLLAKCYEVGNTPQWVHNEFEEVLCDY